MVRRSRLFLSTDGSRRGLTGDAVARNPAWATTVALIAGVMLTVLLARAGDDTKPPFTAITSPPEFDRLLPLSVIRGTVTDECSGVAEVLVSLADPLGKHANFENEGPATLDCNETRTSCTWETRFVLD